MTKLPARFKPPERYHDEHLISQTIPEETRPRTVGQLWEGVICEKPFLLLGALALNTVETLMISSAPLVRRVAHDASMQFLQESEKAPRTRQKVSLVKGANQHTRRPVSNPQRPVRIYGGLYPQRPVSTTCDKSMTTREAFIYCTFNRLVVTAQQAENYIGGSVSLKKNKCSNA